MGEGAGERSHDRHRRFAQTSFVSQPDAGTTSVNGIRLGDGTMTLPRGSISGTALSIGSGGVTMFANTAASTINVPMIVAANQTWTNNAATNNLTINGNVTGNAGTGDTTTLSAACTGTGGMFFNAAILGDGTLGGKLALRIHSTGTGSVTLGSANTYSGATTVSGGQLQARRHRFGGQFRGDGLSVGRHYRAAYVRRDSSTLTRAASVNLGDAVLAVSARPTADSVDQITGALNIGTPAVGPVSTGGVSFITRHTQRRP